MARAPTIEGRAPLRGPVGREPRVRARRRPRAPARGGVATAEPPRPRRTWTAALVDGLEPKETSELAREIERHAFADMGGEAPDLEHVARTWVGKAG